MVIPLIRIEVHRSSFRIKKLHGITSGFPKFIRSSARVLILKVDVPSGARKVAIVTMLLDAAVVGKIVINKANAGISHTTIAWGATHLCRLHALVATIVA